MASTALPACADHRLTRIMYGSNLHPYRPLVHLVQSRALLWPAGIDAHSCTAGSRTPPLSTSILASACTWAGRCWPWAILSNTVSAYSDCGSSSSRLRRFRAPPRC